MMKFFDYFFYRLYKAYDNKKDVPLFASITVLSSNIFLINYPFLGLFCDMAQRNRFDNITDTLFFLDATIIVLLVMHRYHNKVKRENIFKRYKDSKWNKIPSFCFYFVLYVLNAIIGIGGYIFLYKFLIKPLKLDGIFWRWIINLNL